MEDPAVDEYVVLYWNGPWRSMELFVFNNSLWRDNEFSGPVKFSRLW